MADKCVVILRDSSIEFKLIALCVCLKGLVCALFCLRGVAIAGGAAAASDSLDGFAGAASQLQGLL